MISDWFSSAENSWSLDEFWPLIDVLWAVLATIDTPENGMVCFWFFTKIIRCSLSWSVCHQKLSWSGNSGTCDRFNRTPHGGNAISLNSRSNLHQEILRFFPINLCSKSWSSLRNYSFAHRKSIQNTILWSRKTLLVSWFPKSILALRWFRLRALEVVWSCSRGPRMFLVTKT